jgi:hypothetical protein
MEGFRVHYNLIREHQTLGAMPGEVAGLLKIDGFRWLEILKKATKEVTPELLHGSTDSGITRLCDRTR